MATRYTDEFRRDAVRICGYKRLCTTASFIRFGRGSFDFEQVGSEASAGDLISGPHEAIEKENGHLRKEVRLLRENGIKVVRTQKYKATTDSNHTFNIAPNLLGC